MFASVSPSAVRRAMGVALAATLVASLVGCNAPEPEAKSQPAAAKVVMASTTSTQDSGLFDVLKPAFEKANPEYVLDIIAVGTGEALKMGESKDADVLLVHAKSDEEKFVEAGFGKSRADVMYNDFVIVGPKADPAGTKGSADTTAAMKAIASAGSAGKALWYSRGDDSGTHKKELKSWKAAATMPTTTPNAEKWYQVTGSGMGDTLKIASEKQGYTLADRATYLSMKDALDLDITYEKDKGLKNQYGVIVVTGAKNEAGAQAFADWILSPEGQKIVGEFGVEKFGQQLFVPNAGQ